MAAMYPLPKHKMQKDDYKHFFKALEGDFNAITKRASDNTSGGNVWTNSTCVNKTEYLENLEFRK